MDAHLNQPSVAALCHHLRPRIYHTALRRSKDPYLDAQCHRRKSPKSHTPCSSDGIPASTIHGIIRSRSQTLGSYADLKTRHEAEKEVKGFSRSHCRGYTYEDGGRARAERDLEEYMGDQAHQRKDTTVHSHGCEAQGARSTSSEEPIRVYVSGKMAPSPTPPPEEPVRIYVSGKGPPSSTHPPHVLRQLQTPPNTISGTKKARPISWEAEQGPRKKATCVKADGALGEIRYPQLEHMESDIIGEVAMNPDRSGNDTSIDDLSSSDDGFCSPRSKRDSHFDETTGMTDSSSHRLIHTDSDDDSGDSAISFGDHGPHKLSHHNITVTANLLYPRFDHFDPALDYIALGTSSDYGDFPDNELDLDQVSANGPRTEPCLCDEQLALVDLIMNGRNVFYTGSAGCGKSTVLKHIVPLLREGAGSVHVLTPTGRAALEVNGRTIYNYAGWVPHSLSQPLWKLKDGAHRKQVWERLTATRVLIIDEISMVSNHVFERLNCILKSARDSNEPFGGVQIVVTGDFLQLSPV